MPSVSDEDSVKTIYEIIMWLLKRALEDVNPHTNPPPNSPSNPPPSPPPTKCQNWDVARGKGKWFFPLFHEIFFLEDADIEV